MKTASTTTYQEALLEVSKFREVAEEDAKKAVLKAITPLIKEELQKTFYNISEGVLFEEEDPFAPPANNPPQTTPPAAQEPTSPEAPSSEPAVADDKAPIADLGMSLGGDAGSPPESTTPSPSPVQDAGMTPPIPTAPAGLNVPLPDASGKIVVDLADLFTNTPANQEPVVTGATEVGPTEPTTPIGGFPSSNEVPSDSSTPADNPFGEEPTTEGMSYDTFKESVTTLKYKILGHSGKMTSIKKYALEEEVFNLYQKLQTLKENKVKGEKIIDLQEKCLDHLYKRLQESDKQPSIYSKNPKDQTTMSGNLRQFAKKLFEDASAKGSSGFGDTTEHPKGDEEMDKSNAAGKHAMSASDSTPVKDPGKKESLTVGKLTESEEALALEAELKEMFGEDDSEKPIDEAAEVLTDKVADGMDKLSPGKSVNTKNVAVMEAKKKKEALSKKMKALKEEQAKVAKALKECDGMGMTEESTEMPMHGMTDAVNVNIDVDGLEDMSGSDLAGLDDDDEIEITDDSGMPLSFGDDDDSETAQDEWDAWGPSAVGEDDHPSTWPSNFEEARKRTGKIVAENKKLKNSIQEHEVLTARALCVSKLFVREGLTMQDKKKISEYLDMAKTVNEAKEIYSRIKKILDEKKSKNTQAVGSSSAATKSGGVATEALNENVEVSYAPTAARWAKLAGIKVKS